MSDRYLKILPFIALSKERNITVTTLRTFIVMCDVSDEDGYVIDPENYLLQLGLPFTKVKLRGALNKLKNLGWIAPVETIADHNIWMITLEPHHSANVKKFIVTDGTIEVTIKSVGENDWWRQLKEDRTATINSVDWSS